MSEVERRKSTKDLSREMFLRSQEWSPLQLCAVLDIVGSQLIKQDPVHGVDLVLQQTMNVFRKKSIPAGRAAAPAFDQPSDQPEAGALAPGAGCPPRMEPCRVEYLGPTVYGPPKPTPDDFVDAPADGWRGEGLMAAPAALDRLAR